MKSKNIPPREILAKNLTFLKDKFDYTDVDIGKRAKISPKSVNNMYNGRTDVQLEKVEAVANVFGLSVWHMIMPNLETEYENLTDFELLRKEWMASSEEGKKHILSVAEREAKYNNPDRTG